MASKIHGTFLFLGIIAVIITGCVSTPSAPARVNHVVICWLKRAGNATDRLKIIEASRSFKSIPGVLGIRTGTSIASSRKIVDDSYDVAISLSFANTNDLNAYLQHPIHTKVKHETLLPLINKIVVYDFQE